MKPIDHRAVVLSLCLTLTAALGGCGDSTAAPPDSGRPGAADLAQAATADLALAASNDLAASIDLGSASDLARPADLAQAPDLTSPAPADLSSPTPDSSVPLAAQVRFINTGSARLTGTDANKQYSFDIYPAGGTTPLVTGLGFGASSGWQSVLPVKGVKFDLRYAGDPATNAPLFTTADADALDLSGGGQASVIVYGISKINTTGGFKLLGSSDGFVNTSGNAAARFVNVSPVNSAYKLYLDPNGAPTIQVAANTATPPAGVALPAGADVSLLLASNTSSSTMFPAATDATWTLPSALVADGKQLLVILTGQGLAHPRDPVAVVLVVVDAQANAQVLQQDPLLFVVDAEPSVASVDVQTDASKVSLNALTYKLLKHLSLPAGAGVTLRGSASGAPLFTSTTGPLVRGERYLGVLSGAAGVTPSDQSLQLRVYQEQFAPAATAMARVRFVNESPSAPPLDVGIYYTANVLTPIQTMVPFPQAGAPAGAQTAQKSSTMPTLSFGVGSSDDASTLLPFSYLSQLDADDPLFVIASGDWSATAASTAKRVVFVKAPIKSSWQASAPK